jgi:hypothetical protein
MTEFDQKILLVVIQGKKKDYNHFVKIRQQIKNLFAKKKQEF